MWSQVDLLVAETVGGPGRRAARLGVHGNNAAMKVRGLEGALVSHTQNNDQLSDSRRRSLMHPESRRDQRRSWCQRCIRLRNACQSSINVVVNRSPRMPSISTGSCVQLTLLIWLPNWGLLRSHEISSSVTSEALSMFQDLFSTPSAIGTELVVQHVHALEDSDFIAGSSVALSQDLLEATSQ